MEPVENGTNTREDLGVKIPACLGEDCVGASLRCNVLKHIRMRWDIG